MSNDGFGALLRRYRASAHLSQKTLADRSGVSVPAISALERGSRRSPQSSTIERLADALGLDDAQRAELAATASRARTAQQTMPLAAPRQLPPAISDFTGRAADVIELTDLLIGPVPRVPVVTITGMGGVGKTALALHVAHAVSGHYPDGALFLDLHGYGPGSPTPELVALRGLLASLGAYQPESLTDAADAAARFRTMIAGRRMLLVLDNAADTTHVERLIPGTRRCATIITSRRTLTGLAGAEHRHLDSLSETEAIDMLAAIAGRRRVAEDSAAALDVVMRCGRLPLAIRIAAARLVSRPGWPTAHLADRLADAQARLGELQLENAGVSASLAVSLQQLAGSSDALDVRSAEAFAFLGLPRLTEISVRTAAPLLDVDEDLAERILERLVDVGLLTASAPLRYRMHDLIQALAHTGAMTHLMDDERENALTRMFRRTAAVAWRHARLTGPSAVEETVSGEDWDDDARDLETAEEAGRWLESERSELREAVEQAADGGAVHEQMAVRIAVGLRSFYMFHKMWPEWLHTNLTVMDITARMPDQALHAMVCHDAAAALAEVGRHDEARQHLTIGLKAAESTGNLELEMLIRSMLSHVLERTGHLAEGIACGERARQIGIELGSSLRHAGACTSLGMLYAKAGDRSSEEARFAEALAALEDPSHRRWVAMTYLNRGMVRRETGRLEDALADVTRSLDVFREVGYALGEADALDDLGALLVELRQYPRAMTVQKEGLSIALERKDTHREASIRRRLGTTLAALGRRAEARAEWQRALELHDRYGIGGADEVRRLLND